jgi:hypothetical protein
MSWPNVRDGVWVVVGLYGLAGSILVHRIVRRAPPHFFSKHDWHLGWYSGSCVAYLWQDLELVHMLPCGARLLVWLSWTMCAFLCSWMWKVLWVWGLVSSVSPNRALFSLMTTHDSLNRIESNLITSFDSKSIRKNKTSKHYMVADHPSKTPRVDKTTPDEHWGLPRPP